MCYFIPGAFDFLIDGGRSGPIGLKICENDPFTCWRHSTNFRPDWSSLPSLRILYKMILISEIIEIWFKKAIFWVQNINPSSRFLTEDALVLITEGSRSGPNWLKICEVVPYTSKIISVNFELDRVSLTQVTPFDNTSLFPKPWIRKRKKTRIFRNQELFVESS